MNYYNEIKNKLIDNEIYSKVKDYSKERHKVITYFEIGKLLNEAGGKYGDNIIDEYSKKLVVEVGKKYNRRTLFRMKQFYNMFSDEKVSQLATQLSWSHYVELLPLKNIDEIKYYINICKEKNVGRDLLREKIKNKEYNRLPIETKDKLVSNEKMEVKDLVPNPILIRNKNNVDIITEKALHQLILEDIDLSYFDNNKYYEFLNGRKMYKEAFIEFMNDDLMDEYNKHDNDIYIIHGDKDNTVLLKDVEYFCKKNNINLKVIEGAEHGMKNYLDLVNIELLNYLKK